MFSAKTDTCCKHGKCKQSSKSSPNRQNPRQADRECAKLPFAQEHQDGLSVAVIFDAPGQFVSAAGLFHHTGRLQSQVVVDPLATSPPDLVVLTGSFLI
jgi:hypothetical protein